MLKNNFYSLSRLVVFMTCLLGQTLHGQSPKQIESFTKNRDERVSWWREARYGMFIHWGVYAELAGEWKGKRINGPGEWIMYNAKIPVNEYEKMAADFNPVKFNAEEWVKIAKEAGMKYIIITAKHCDGFAMFDSEVNNYNIVDFTPFIRDPLEELREACNNHGLKLGFYYSHNWDWHEPNAKGLDNTWDFPETEEKTPETYYENKSIPQIKELVKDYSPDVMWFDVPTDITFSQSFKILKTIREISPDCIINDRISSEHQEKKLVMGDFYTPEQYLPENLNINFETCMTLNDTWGYKYYDHNWKDVKTIIKNLVTNASMGGNYLLNVGPDHLGRIPPQSVQLLKEVGNWLERNGESIYRTDKSPLEHVFYNNGACTFRPGKLYIHLFDWPQSNEFALPEVAADVERIYFLADKTATKLNYTLTADKDIIIDLPPGDISAELLAQPVHTLVVDYTGELEAQQLPPIIDPFHTATFLPADAKFLGNISYEFNKRWGEHRGNELKTWNEGGTMQWNYRTIREGTYDIELVYGATELGDDNDIHVKIGDQDIKHKIKDPEGWYTYKTIKVGEISLPKDTTGSVSVYAGYSNTHAIANFKQLRLVPKP